jgi:hypothetical protein
MKSRMFQGKLSDALVKRGAINFKPQLNYVEIMKALLETDLRLVANLASVA